MVPASRPPHPARTRVFLLVAGLVVLAALVRVPALFTEFWLDEIWSWQVAHSIARPWQVFTHLQHDNNHHLNTLALYSFQPGLPWQLYRLHAFLPGLLAVPLGMAVAWRWGRPAALFAGILLACNFWLVLASTEARGYALAMVFALLSVLTLRRVLDAAGGAGERLWVPVFWAVVLLGFLSHLTFGLVYMGLVAWSFRATARRRLPQAEELRQALWLHAVPALTVGVYYVVMLRDMQLGGAPPGNGYLPVLASLFGRGLGGPGGGYIVLPWVLAAAAILVSGCRLLARGDDEWVFFAVTVFAAPAAYVIKGPPFLFERYFYLPFLFLLVLLGRLLAEAWRTRPALAVAGLVLVTVGNLVNVAGFVERGRGDLLPLLSQAASEEGPATPVMTVAGDNDFRVELCVSFYSAYLPGPGRVRYVREGEVPPGGADWLVVHRLDDRYPAPAEERDAAGNLYRLAAGRPSRGFACWGWFLYRNARTGEGGPAPVTPPGRAPAEAGVAPAGPAGELGLSR